MEVGVEPIGKDEPSEEDELQLGHEDSPTHPIPRLF